MSTHWPDFAHAPDLPGPFKGKKNKTSIRGAYGVFWDTPDYFELTAFANTLPYSYQIVINQPHSFSDPYFGMLNPFPYHPPTTQQGRQSLVYPVPTIIGESIDPNLVNAYVQQWNFNIQHEILWARNRTHGRLCGIESDPLAD